MKNRNSIFKDPFISEQVTMNEEKSKFNTQERLDLEKASVSVSKGLMSLHNIKPPNRKVNTISKYKGGSLSVEGTLNSILGTGKIQMKEFRREMKNPDRPRVALILDNSYSMTSTRVTKAGCLLANAFIYFLGNGFAKSFDLSFIGNYGYDKLSSNLPYFQSASTTEAMQTILKTNYNQAGTHFSPPLNMMEKMGFFDGIDTKYVILITDGVPEHFRLKTDVDQRVAKRGNIFLGNGIDIAQEGFERLDYAIDKQDDDASNLAFYLRERWKNNRKVHYFMIILGPKMDPIEWIKWRFGYDPEKRKETRKSFFNSDSYKELAEFYWEAQIGRASCRERVCVGV